MDLNLDPNKVIEAHLDSGKTIPLRPSLDKKGNTVWAVLDRRPAGKSGSGERFYNGFGVTVPLDMFGHPDKISSIKVDGIGSIKLRHDVNPRTFNQKTGRTTGGNPRAIGEKEFTSGGETYKLTFRATVKVDRNGGETVNLLAEIKKAGIEFKTRVLTEL